MNVSLGVERDLSPVFETGRIELEGLQPILEEFAETAAADARNGWPVDTGTSRDAWEASAEATETSLTIQVSNRAFLRGRSYAAYVHRSGERRLVFTEVEERLKSDLIPNLQADIALALAEHLRR